MVAVTIALAYYAYKTIDEAKKDRTKDSIEKQLEKLCSPIFEILIRAKPYEQMPLTPAQISWGSRMS
jgi:hypothetical protein